MIRSRDFMAHVSCGNGHQYDQHIELRGYALEYISTHLIPCCGVCGERENYSVALAKWQVVGKPDTPQ